MLHGKKVSLVFPAYNEEQNIGRAIKEFLKIIAIDEIIVIDNNSSDSTAALAKKNGAKVFLEKEQGYGFALRRGLKEASGDYIILCEPDGTFVAKDVTKLLSLVHSYDVVLGTRTNASYIQSGANMHGLLRIANIVLAKVIQILFLPTTSLSDCGCTFRVIKKSVIKKVLPKLTVGDSHFLVDLLICCIQSKSSIKEIPVHYQKRVGESKITGSFRKAVIVGWRMLSFTVSRRLGTA